VLNARVYDEFGNEDYTDALGNYELAVLSGTHTLRVSNGGNWSTPNTRVVNVSVNDTLEDEDFYLNPNAVVLWGYVRSGATALGAAQVAAQKGVVTSDVNTDMTGRYETSVQFGTWVLTAAKSGYITSGPETVYTNPGDTVQQDFNLVSDIAYVRGVVRDDRGQVVAGVITSVVGRSALDTTDLGGAYFMSTASGVGLTVRALKGGYVTKDSVVNLLVGETLAVDLVVRENESVVRGTVQLITDSSAMAGVRVFDQLGNEDSTDAGGNYEIVALSGLHIIKVSLAGYTSAPESVNVAVAVNDTAENNNFFLNPNAGIIQGYVRAGGTPVGNALVQGTDGGHNGSDLTDLTGFYQFSVAPGTWILDASKSGYVTSAPETLTINPGATVSQDFNLTLDIAYVTGTVKDSAGTALAQASVEIVGTSIAESTDALGRFFLTTVSGANLTVKASKTGYSTDDSVLIVLAIGDTAHVALTLNANTHLIKGLVRDSALTDTLDAVSVYITGVDSQVTGPSGTYGIWVDAGTYTLHFRHPGYLDKDSSVTVLPAVDTLTVNARLRPNFATLAGHVRDGMSNNLDSVLITASGANGTWTGYTAASGLYSITGIYPGLYTVTANKAGYTPVPVSIDSTLAGRATTTLDFTLHSNNGTITGTVRQDSATGAAVAVASVQAQIYGLPTIYAAVTDSLGSYTISGLPTFGSPEFRVTSYKAGFTALAASAVESVNAGQAGVALVLYKNDGIISGFAYYDSTGTTGVGGKTVTIAQAGGGTYQVNTLSSGAFSKTDLAPEEAGYNYVVTINAEPGYTVQPDSHAVRTDTTGLVFRFIRDRGMVSGTVRDDAGFVLPGADVVVSDYATGLEYANVTNGSGQFTVGGLPSLSKFRVRVSAPGYTGLDSSVVESVNTNTAGLRLKLYVNDGIISGTARLDSLTGPGAGSRTVTIEQLAGPTYTINTAANGTFSKIDLPPSQAGYYYRISLDALSGYTTPAAKESVQTDSIGLRFIYIRQTGTISGVVRNDTGAVLAGVNVVVYDYATALEYANVTNASGQFNVGGLPSLSKFRVSVSAPGFTGLDSSVVESVNTNAANVYMKLYSNDGTISGIAYLDSVNGPAADGRTVTIEQIGGGTYTVNTIANGTFSKTDLPPAAANLYYRISLDAYSGYATPAAKESVQTDSTGLVFVYVRQIGTVSGTVRNDAGAAVAGANVVVYDYATGLEYADVSDSVTGAFTVGGLPSLSKFRVSAAAVGHTGLDSSVIESVATNTANLRMKLYINDGVLSGIAYLDSLNGPSADGRTVTIEQIGGGTYTVNTIANGTFSKTDLPPAAANLYYRISLDAYSGYATPAAKESVQTDSTGLMFVYVRQIGTISGTVRNDAGAAVAGANVVVYDYATGLEYADVSDSVTGAFTVGGLPSLSKFRVSVAAVGHTGLDSSVIESVATNTAGLRMKLYVNDGILSGIAYLDSANGPRANGRTVTIVQAGGPTYSINTIANGTFNMNDLPPAEAGFYYRISLDAFSGYATPAAKESVQTDSIGLVFVYIRQIGTISGTVRNDTGGVIPNANIVVEDYATSLTSPGVSNGLGNFTVNGLPSLAHFRVSVSAAGHTGLDSSVAESVATNTANLRMKLYIDDGTFSGIAYLDSVNGPTANGRIVTIRQLPGSPYTVSTGSDGTFSKTDLPPSEANLYYQVSIDTVPGYRVPAAKNSIQTDTTGLLFVYEKIAQVLEVTTLFADDSLPVDSAMVHVKDRTGGDWYAVTGSSGKVAFNSLVGGHNYDVFAEKYSVTLLANSTIHLAVAAETTKDTLYLVKASIVRLEIKIDNYIQNNQLIANNTVQTFTYEAFDGADNEMHVDPSMVTWSHAPWGASNVGADTNFYGTLTPLLALGKLTAIFKPDSTTFGLDDIRLRAVTANGSIIEAVPKKIRVYAPLYAGSMPSQVVLRQYQGVHLTVDRTDMPTTYVVGFTAQRGDVLEVKKATKKFQMKGSSYLLEFVTGSSPSLIVDRGITMRGNLDISLPTPANLSLRDEAGVGMWSTANIGWTQLPMQTRTADFIGSYFRTTASGEFAVIVSSGVLGLSQIELTPNPFSPRVREMNIFFRVDSKETREPLISVHVRTVTGIPVRTICLNRPFNKGSEVHLIWDGRSDQGQMCRNGRYLLELAVEDPSGTERVYKPIMMVK
jgi:hypothetical protein